MKLKAGQKIIKTVTITPTKEMPLEVFKACWHLAYFMELMQRLPDGRVIWDENVIDIIDENMAEIEHYALQQGYISINFELPTAFVEQFK